MKRPRHRETVMSESPRGRGPDNHPPLRPTRLWLFRIILFIGFPVAFLGLTEVGLRLVGFGHATRFFQTITEGEVSHIETNDQFTFRFFPRALARAVVPHRLEAPKPPDTYRILLFGESAANGDPDPAHGFGRHLEVLLNERFAGARFEVVCAAITAINSHAIAPIAREAARLESDLWILYMGNNEVIGPYGPGTVFGRKAPPMPIVRASLALKTTRLGQALDTLVDRLRRTGSEAVTWEGINLFAENLLHPDDAARARVHSHFRKNLKTILAAGERAGVPVLLATVASNLKDCAPFASLHRPDLSAARKAEWAALFAEGRELEAAENFAEALARYEQAAAIDSTFAELPFRMARCHEALGAGEAAYRAYIAARDADALAVRADSAITRLIREAADRRRGTEVRLVDTVALLGFATTGEIPGRDLFYEHVHFNPVGNYEMARIFAEHIVAILPTRIRERGAEAWVGPAVCQRILAFTLWDQHRLWEEMAQRQSQPPFTARHGSDYEVAYCRLRAERLEDRKDHPLNRVIYERALEANPQDYFLRTRFAAYLRLNGFLDEAAAHFQWAAETFPNFVAPHQEHGLTLFLLERYPEARARFKRVLEINPDYEKAHTALGLIEARHP